MTNGKWSNQVHYVFESLFSQKIQQDVIHQIAGYSFCPQDELIIHVMPVQRKKWSRLWTTFYSICNEYCFWRRSIHFNI